MRAPVKYFFAFLLLAATPLLADDVAATLKKQADLCSGAVMKNDYAGLAALTHPRVVEKMGGKDAMLASLTETFDQLKKNGVAVESSISKEPTAPQKIGNWLVSTIPTEVVMKTSDKRMRIFSEMVAISEDGGKTWVFADAGGFTADDFFKLFPELKDKITLTPARPTAIEPL